MHDELVTILENRKINEKYYKLTVSSKKLTEKVLPGQFVQIQIEPHQDPFLRRPFSYYRIHSDRFEVLYEILGRGTALLAHKREGNSLKVLGPLGKPFSLKVPKNKKRVLIAGGVGVPPLIYLAETEGTDYLLIGTKSMAEVMPIEEMRAIKGDILYSTNDGSHGLKGFVTALLEKIIEEQGAENLFVQTCGPMVMMQAVMGICKKQGIAGEASLEKEMACGVGVCLGCMVQTEKGLVPSCTQGPVFDFDRIQERLA